MAFGSVNVPGKINPEDIGAAAASHSHSNYLLTSGGSVSGNLSVAGSVTVNSLGFRVCGEYTPLLSSDGGYELQVQSKKINFIVPPGITGSPAFTVNGSADSFLSAIGAARASHSHTPADVGAAAACHSHSGYASSSHSHSEYAPKASPVFSGTISLGRKAGSTSGISSVAEGVDVTASGNYSHAEGYDTKATAIYCHAEGLRAEASGTCAHAEGQDCIASGSYAHASGYDTIAAGKYQTVIGKHNKESSAETDKFIIGSGIQDNYRSNCFRVTENGVFAKGNYNATGADYAELFEWADGNLDAEDRTGLFVTLDGEKIRVATPQDDFILGIISGNPSVVGDVHDDQWQGMYLYDIFGRPIWEDVDIPEVTAEIAVPVALETGEIEIQKVTQVVEAAHIEHRQKLNPAYDGSKPYVPRSKRPEWGCVGMLGKLVVIDDGTCQVNACCAVGEGGKATLSNTKTKFRVMSRIDECHVRVLVL